jgi:hypothetical protein
MIERVQRVVPMSLGMCVLVYGSSLIVILGDLTGDLVEKRSAILDAGKLRWTPRRQAPPERIDRRPA